MTDFLLSPLTWLIAASLVLLGARRRWLRLPAIALATLALVATTPLGANALVRLVEIDAGDPASCAAPLPEAIVVLGGGFDGDPQGADDVVALSAPSLRRLLAGAAAFARDRTARLYIAGAADERVPESRVLAALAERLGVPAAAITTEQTSMTTWENAEHLRALPQPPPTRIALVSSALHLPRALVAFRAAGFDACAIASDSAWVPPRGLGYFLPRTSALRKADAAIHEIVGMLVYRWRARQPAAASLRSQASAVRAMTSMSS